MQNMQNMQNLCIVLITDDTEILCLKFPTITIACKLGLLLWPNMLGKQNVCEGAQIPLLRTKFDLWAKKRAFLGQKQCFLGKKCTITWYILHVLRS